MVSVLHLLSRRKVIYIARKQLLQPLSCTMTSKSSSPTAISSTFTSNTDSAFDQEIHQPSKRLRYVDIGINLTDPTFQGIYNGKQVHENDIINVIQRAHDSGCQKMIVTGSDLEQSRNAIKIAEENSGICYATIGIHPCSCTQFDSYPSGPTSLLESLESLALKAKASSQAVAFGEIGLDYDRLYLTPKDVQLKYFEAQLAIAVKVQLPLFLHSRAASEDFERILGAKLAKLPKGGVVHSFTGTKEEMQRLVAMGLSIGVNGCSLKTDQNLEVVKEIPLDRLMIETDGPWCEIRPSHASHAHLPPPSFLNLPRAVKKEKFIKGQSQLVKGRNEPATIGHVAYVIASVKGISVEEVSEKAWKNSVRMFGLESNEAVE